MSERVASRVASPRDWIALTRPRQWSKNLLLYAAFFFTAGDAWDDLADALPLLARATLGFLAFCALSAAGYALNDVRDAELDGRHPRKRQRPVAAGRIEEAAALRAAYILVAVGLVLSLPLGWWFAAAALGYLAGTFGYSAALKRLPVVDVVSVAGLFALRALAGALAIEVDASLWILVCTFAGALFVVSVKRQQEQWLLGAEAGAHRETLDARSRWPRWLVALSGSATVGLYVQYTLSAPNLPDDGSMTWLTAPFVLAAVARYYAVARAHPERDAEEIAFRDPVTLMLVVGFVAAAVGRLLSAG
ncbi:MAG: UbiA family prenyltransferase [Dehalococcoidia bacterium]